MSRHWSPTEVSLWSLGMVVLSAVLMPGTMIITVPIAVVCVIGAHYEL